MKYLKVFLFFFFFFFFGGRGGGGQGTPKLPKRRENVAHIHCILVVNSYPTLSKIQFSPLYRLVVLINRFPFVSKVLHTNSLFQPHNTIGSPHKLYGNMIIIVSVGKQYS